MDAYALLCEEMPEVFENCSKSGFYEYVENLPLMTKKRVLRSYLRRNKQLRVDYEYERKCTCPCAIKKTFRDYKIEKICYEKRRDVIKKCQARKDQRCIVQKIVEIPKGTHMHHKDGNVFNCDPNNFEFVKQKKHIKIHKKERQKQKKEDLRVSRMRIFNF